MKFFERVLKIFFDILIFVMLLLIFIMAFNFFQINILKKPYSNMFGYSLFEVSTGSMSGTIEVNDIILVKITKDVEINDIITFKKDNDIITHRIVAMNKGNVVTKGDANNQKDEPIKEEDIIGKVIKNFHKLGIWTKVLSDSKVKISIIITVFLLGAAIHSKDDESQKENTHTFSKFMRKRRDRKNGKKKEKKKV